MGKMKQNRNLSNSNVYNKIHSNNTTLNNCKNNNYNVTDEVSLLSNTFNKLSNTLNISKNFYCSTPSSSYAPKHPYNSGTSSHVKDDTNTTLSSIQSYLKYLQSELSKPQLTCQVLDTNTSIDLLKYIVGDNFPINYWVNNPSMILIHESDLQVYLMNKKNIHVHHSQGFVTHCYDPLKGIELILCFKTIFQPYHYRRQEHPDQQQQHERGHENNNNGNNHTDSTDNDNFDFSSLYSPNFDVHVKLYTPSSWDRNMNTSSRHQQQMGKEKDNREWAKDDKKDTNCANNKSADTSVNILLLPYFETMESTISENSNFKIHLIVRDTLGFIKTLCAIHPKADSLKLKTIHTQSIQLFDHARHFLKNSEEQHKLVAQTLESFYTTLNPLSDKKHELLKWLFYGNILDALESSMNLFHSIEPLIQTRLQHQHPACPLDSFSNVEDYETEAESVQNEFTTQSIKKALEVVHQHWMNFVLHDHSIPSSDKSQFVSSSISSNKFEIDSKNNTSPNLSSSPVSHTFSSSRSVDTGNLSSAADTNNTFFMNTLLESIHNLGAEYMDMLTLCIAKPYEYIDFTAKTPSALERIQFWSNLLTNSKDVEQSLEKLSLSPDLTSQLIYFWFSSTYHPRISQQLFESIQETALNRLQKFSQLAEQLENKRTILPHLEILFYSQFQLHLHLFTCSSKAAFAISMFSDHILWSNTRSLSIAHVSKSIQNWIISSETKKRFLYVSDTKDSVPLALFFDAAFPISQSGPGFKRYQETLEKSNVSNTSPSSHNHSQMADVSSPGPYHCKELFAQIDTTLLSSDSISSSTTTSMMMTNTLCLSLVEECFLMAEENLLTVFESIQVATEYAILENRYHFDTVSSLNMTTQEQQIQLMNVEKKMIRFAENFIEFDVPQLCEENVLPPDETSPLQWCVPKFVGQCRMYVPLIGSFEFNPIILSSTTTTTHHKNDIHKSPEQALIDNMSEKLSFSEKEELSFFVIKHIRISNSIELRTGQVVYAQDIDETAHSYLVHRKNDPVQFLVPRDHLRERYKRRITSNEPSVIEKCDEYSIISNLLPVQEKFIDELQQLLIVSSRISVVDKVFDHQNNPYNEITSDRHKLEHQSTESLSLNTHANNRMGQTNGKLLVILNIFKKDLMKNATEIHQNLLSRWDRGVKSLEDISLLTSWMFVIRSNQYMIAILPWLAKTQDILTTKLNKVVSSLSTSIHNYITKMKDVWSNVGFVGLAVDMKSNNGVPTSVSPAMIIQKVLKAISEILDVLGCVTNNPRNLQSLLFKIGTDVFYHDPIFSKALFNKVLSLNEEQVSTEVAIQLQINLGCCALYDMSWELSRQHFQNARSLLYETTTSSFKHQERFEEYIKVGLYLSTTIGRHQKPSITGCPQEEKVSFDHKSLSMYGSLFATLAQFNFNEQHTNWSRLVWNTLTTIDGQGLVSLAQSAIVDGQYMIAVKVLEQLNFMNLGTNLMSNTLKNESNFMRQFLQNKQLHDLNCIRWMVTVFGDECQELAQTFMFMKQLLKERDPKKGMSLSKLSIANHDYGMHFGTHDPKEIQFSQGHIIEWIGDAVHDPTQIYLKNTVTGKAGLFPKSMQNQYLRPLIADENESGIVNLNNDQLKMLLCLNRDASGFFQEDVFMSDTLDKTVESMNERNDTQENHQQKIDHEDINDEEQQHQTNAAHHEGLIGVLKVTSPEAPSLEDVTNPMFLSSEDKFKMVQKMISICSCSSTSSSAQALKTAITLLAWIEWDKRTLQVIQETTSSFVSFSPILSLIVKSIDSYCLSWGLCVSCFFAGLLQSEMTESNWMPSSCPHSSSQYDDHSLSSKSKDNIITNNSNGHGKGINNDNTRHNSTKVGTSGELVSSAILSSLFDTKKISESNNLTASDKGKLKTIETITKHLEGVSLKELMKFKKELRLEGGADYPIFQRNVDSSCLPPYPQS